MADNFDNYSMKVQARVDMPNNKDIDAQIRKLEKSISKLKVSGQFDDTALKNLTNQLNSLKATISTANFSPTALTELTNQVNRALQNIQISNINVGNIGNQAQQVGQQIGNNIAQGISSGVNKAKSELKSFSDLTNFSELNKKIEHLQIDPSALKFGDRIDNKATVVGTYDSNDGKTYVYAVLDAQYRGANIAWSTGLYDSDIDTGLPNYESSASLNEQNHESATYNTDFIINNYSDHKFFKKKK